MANELEQFKNLQAQMMEYSQKFEVFEGKMHENYMVIQDMKHQLHNKHAVEHEKAAGHEKGFEILLRETKGQIMKKLDNFIKVTEENLARNDPIVLETKMVNRMNDAVIVLTR